MARVLTLAAVTVGLWAAACSGQSDPLASPLTVDPRLVRGAAAAAVTIVEFSDYE